MRRYLWAQGTERLSVSGTADLLDLCWRCHVTDLLFLAHSGTYQALWASDMFHWSLTLEDKPYLEYLIGEAAKKGIRVHGWLCVGSWPWMWGMLKDGLPAWKWPQGNWLDMTNPDARTAVGGAVADLAKVPGLAGVHLDYIRRPDGVENPTIQPEHVTSCVANAQLAVETQGPPGLELTAAVVPHTFSGWDMTVCAQPWVDWLDNGNIDTAMPMLYYNAETVGGQLDYIAAESGVVMTNTVIGVSPASPQGELRTIDTWEAVLDLCSGRGYELAVFDDTLLNINFQPALEARPLTGGNGVGITEQLSAVVLAMHDEAELVLAQAQARVDVLIAQADELSAGITALSDVAAQAGQVADDAQTVADQLEGAL